MPRHPGRSGAAWQRARTATLNDWHTIHGNLCPGYQRAPHPTDERNPLTVDHIIPISRGGEPHARDNLTVLCHACNAAKKDRPATALRPTPTRAW